jgi:hypothetical protein
MYQYVSREIHGQPILVGIAQPEAGHEWVAVGFPQSGWHADWQTRCGCLVECLFVTVGIYAEQQATREVQFYHKNSVMTIHVHVMKYCILMDLAFRIVHGRNRFE